MKQQLNGNTGFWKYLDKLVNESEIVIDKQKGSSHKELIDVVYVVDYGYLKNTKSMDNSGIDVWKGSKNETEINGIFCTIDLFRKDSEIKILVGCTDDEIKKIQIFYDSFESSKGLLILKETSIGGYKNEGME